jgi:hypothetical protein
VRDCNLNLCDLECAYAMPSKLQHEHIRFAVRLLYVRKCRTDWNGHLGIRYKFEPWDHAHYYTIAYTCSSSHELEQEPHV